MVFILLAVQAGAAPAGPQDLPLPARPEVVVTARHQVERIEDAPLSVAVFEGHEMERGGIDDVDRLVRAIPNVVRPPRGPVGNASIAIRGIFSPIGAASVGVYVDDVPVQIRPVDFAGDPDLRLWDLERVEVLRGPQGTLFGASSLSGTLRLVTAAPDGSRASHRILAEVGSVRGGGWGGALGAMATGPLAGERLAYRLSARLTRDAGFVDKVAADGRAVARDINGETHATIRGALRARLGDVTVTPSLLVERSRRDDLATFQSDLGAFRQAFPVDQPGRDALLLGTVTVSAPAGRATFTSITSVLDRSGAQTSDYSTVFGELVLGGAFPGLIPPGGSRSRVSITQRHFSQELRLTSAPGDALHWVAGLFFQRSAFDLLQRVSEPGLGTATQQSLGANVEAVFGVPQLPGAVSYLGGERVVETRAAAYGEATLRLARGLEAFAGVRFSRSQVDLEVASSGPYAGSNEPIEARGRQVETPVTPRAGLRYRITPGLTGYASAGRGFRAGGANTPVPSGPCQADLAAFGLDQAPSQYGSDSVWSYEAGLKHGSRRFDLRAAAFLLDWTNTLQQVELPNCGFSYNANLGSVRSRGFELEVAVRPARGLTLSLASGYTDARFRRTIVSSAGAQIVGAGDRVPYVPRTALRIAGSFERPLGRRRLHLDAALEAHGAFVRSPAPPAQSHVAVTYRGPGYATLDVSVGLRSRRWDASLFAANLTGARPILYDSADLVPATHRPLRQASIAPRTLGLRLTRSF